MKITKQINRGIRYSLITLTISLVFAIVILENIVKSESNTFLDETKLLFEEFGITIILTIVILYLISFWLGKKAVIQIIDNNKDSEVVGTITGMKVFFFGLLSGSTINLIEHCIRFQVFRESRFIFDAFLNPFFSICLFGIIPAFIISVCYGKLLKWKMKNE